LLDHKGSDKNELQILSFFPKLCFQIFSKLYFLAEIDTVVRKKALTQISFVSFIDGLAALRLSIYFHKKNFHRGSEKNHSLDIIRKF